MTSRALTYGGVPVPYTVSWSGEEEMQVERCRFAGGQLAICQISEPGSGKPQFARPHWIRQREAISRGLCDLCGTSLNARTKVSLSHAAPVPHGADGWAILQVEPLLHRDCAVTCLDHCPSLKRDIEAGTLKIRQVLKWQCQISILDPAYAEDYGVVIPAGVKPAGHAKVELLRWRERDLDWLGGDIG